MPKFEAKQIKKSVLMKVTAESNAVEVNIVNSTFQSTNCQIYPSYTDLKCI